jgi:hypothetical protein
MARRTAKDKGRRWWALAKYGGFFTGAKLSQLWLLITFAQEGYYFLEAIPVTAIEASRRDYPAGIWVNHEIVLDERH